MELIRGYQPVIRDDGAHDEAHWVLDHAGAYVVFVLDRGEDPDSVPWRKEPGVAAIGSMQRRHTRGVNGLMAALLGHGRRGSDASLVLWWSEARFAAWYDSMTSRDVAENAYWSSPWCGCRPDAYGVWREDGAELPFSLEYDRGTETLDRLCGKLPGYTDLALLFGRPIWVLVATTKARRERNIADILDGAKVPIATAAFPDHLTPEPWRAVWRPAESTSPVRLIDLVGQPMPDPVRDLARNAADPERRAEDPRTRDAVWLDRTPPDPCNPDGTR